MSGTNVVALRQDRELQLAVLASLSAVLWFVAAKTVFGTLWAPFGTAMLIYFATAPILITLPLLIASLVYSVDKRKEAGRWDHLPHGVWAIGVIALVVYVASAT